LPEHIQEDVTLVTNVEALTGERNDKYVSVDWQFRTADARIKLIKLYPSISV
jgi:hypothetical protein